MGLCEMTFRLISERVGESNNGKCVQNNIHTRLEKPVLTWHMTHYILIINKLL